MTDSKPKKKCFTIMPFTVKEGDLERYYNDRNHWQEVYSGLIVPAVEKADLICERDDEDSSSRLITENIWRKVEEANVILCDLSANNPNVYLELGWALRADKRFVLIKDDLTNRHFDLNQYYTYEYSHRLQPSYLHKAIDGLSQVICKTLEDERKQYSIVSKLSLQLEAIEAVRGGNVEAGLLRELLNEVRTMQRNPKSYQESAVPPPLFLRSVRTQADLAKMLPGTMWVKKNEIEMVTFKEQPTFLYRSVGDTQWVENSYTLGERLGQMTLLWRWDNFKAECEFFEGFTKFMETVNPECIWTLVSP
jgi:hypothetical protein